ncbi:MAG TPA: hypothetical protein GXZ52_01010 [Clostridiales bacterium]|nr:hypothetical protein [Clostridiales bacterium]
MKTVRLGNTGLIVTKPAMGCLPIQRCSTGEAVKILQAAYDGGINFFDTANSYTDSEEKIGLALSHVRDKIVMNMLLRRSPWRQYFTPEWREKMSRIKDCMQCGQCRSKCPYGLNIPELLKYMLEDYNSFYEQHREEM